MPSFLHEVLLKQKNWPVIIIDILCNFQRFICPMKRVKIFTLQAVGFSYVKQWRNRHEQLSAFSIEHSQVRHTPHDASDAIFICQLIFRWKCLYKRMQISPQKLWQTNDSNQGFLALSCAGLLSSLNTILQTTIWNNTSLTGVIRLNQVCKSPFKRLDGIKIKNWSAHKSLEE